MHLEALTSKAKKIFPQLKSFSQFYLAGGTALALQIGHRVSEDFDFFNKKEISDELLSKVKNTFEHQKVEPVVSHSKQLTVRVDQVNISFITYPFPVLSELINHQGIFLLPSLEIAAMKAYVLGRRATFKDYVDLYFVLKEKVVSLSDLINLCQEKYGEEFNARLFLEQLLYLEDVEKIKIRFLGNKVNREEIKNFFEDQIKNLEI